MQIPVAIVITLALVAGGLGGSFLQKRSFARDAQSLAYYESTYLRKQGWAEGVGQYEFLSFDGGKEWYAVERIDDGAMVILGTVEDIFPGLLGRLYGMDVLIEYAKKNGPLTLSGARSETDQVILEVAGFEIKKKQ